MAPLDARSLSNLADALVDLGKLRHSTGVTPGPFYDRPRIALGDDTWILTWVDDPEDPHGGHYTAELDHG